MRQAKLEAGGMSAEAAPTQSRRTLGNHTLAREDARQIWIGMWLETFCPGSAVRRTRACEAAGIRAHGPADTRARDWRERIAGHARLKPAVAAVERCRLEYGRPDRQDTNPDRKPAIGSTRCCVSVEAPGGADNAPSVNSHPANAAYRFVALIIVTIPVREGESCVNMR
jgi:hypothetical protein